MSIVNLQRDAIFLQLDTALNIGMSSDSGFSATAFFMNAVPVVEDIFASVQSNHQVQPVLIPDQIQSIGVFLKPPGLDTTPFRVKAYAASVSKDAQFYLSIGYAPAVITGVNDTIEQPVYLALPHHFDELIMIPALKAADPLFGRPIAFAISSTSNPTSTENVLLQLSVQNLAIAPPAFAQSTS